MFSGGVMVASKKMMVASKKMMAVSKMSLEIVVLIGLCKWFV